MWVLARQMGDGSRVLGKEKRLGKGTECETAGSLKATINSRSWLEHTVSGRGKEGMWEKWVHTSS